MRGTCHSVTERASPEETEATLRRVVALARELGLSRVTTPDGFIVDLGPAPATGEPTPIKVLTAAERAHADRVRRHRILFGSSSMRPLLDEPGGPAHDPKAGT